MLRLKNTFHYSKHPMDIDKANIEIIVISNKVLVSVKALYVDKITPLCIKLPKMSRQETSFDETNYMFCLIKDGEKERKIQ